MKLTLKFTFDFGSKQQTPKTKRKQKQLTSDTTKAIESALDLAPKLIKLLTK